MKIKLSAYAAVIVSALFVFTLVIGCASAPVSTTSEPEAVEVQDEPKDEPLEVEVSEPAPEEPEAEESPAEVDVVSEEDSEEYQRSVADINVSVETFEADKQQIFHMIEELSQIMKDRNYKLWATMLDKESYVYWDNPKNLKALSKKKRNLPLNTLEDFFTYIFIPSRAGKNVDEIRYESENLVKAVLIKEDGTEVVYYNFQKVNGLWKVHLPKDIQ